MTPTLSTKAKLRLIAVFGGVFASSYAYGQAEIPKAFRGVSFAIEAQEAPAGLNEAIPFSEQLADGSAFTTEQHQQCTEIYMSIDRIREHEITATEVPESIESTYVLKNIVNAKNQRGTFVGQFKYGDESGSRNMHTLTFTPATGNGFALTIDKNPKQTYVQCTIEDYKTAIQRLGGITNSQYLVKEDIPSTTEYAEAQRLEAENAIEMYSEKPQFGLRPHDILHPAQ